MAAPPEPAAVHFVKRSPEHHHTRLLELLQTVGHTVEFVHPTNVRFGVGRKQGLKVNPRVAQPAPVLVCPGRVVKMRADRHQSALVPIRNRRLVGRPGADAALACVVGPQQPGPVTRFVMNLGYQAHVRPGPEVGELAGHQPLVGTRLEALKIEEDRLRLRVRARVGGWFGCASGEQQQRRQRKCNAIFHVIVDAIQSRVFRPYCGYGGGSMGQSRRPARGVALHKITRTAPGNAILPSNSSLLAGRSRLTPECLSTAPASVQRARR